MKRLVAAATAVLVTLLIGGCGASDEPVEVTWMIGAYEDLASGEDVGEVFTEGPVQAGRTGRATSTAKPGRMGRTPGSRGYRTKGSPANWSSRWTLTKDEGDTCVAYFTETETITNDNGTWEGTSAISPV